MNHLQFLDKFRKTPERRPQLTLLAAFAMAIILGGFLLYSPLAQAKGIPRLSLIDSFFISASATCVTGLSVTDVSQQFSFFGQMIIILLTQIGGIGIMTFAAFFVLLAGKKLSTDNESLLTSSMGGETNKSLKSLLLRTITITLLIEGIGAGLLTWRYSSIGAPLRNAIKLGCFHSASAFCNAGFTLYHDSLISIRTDLWLMLIIGVLIIFGGLGFYVMLSLGKLLPRNYDNKRARTPIHCSIVLWATFWLILIGTCFFLGFEWNHSLQELSPRVKIGTALFQTVSSRTAGFNVVNMETTSIPTQFFTIALMFIGGAPGSTAGGAKVTTIVILLATMLAIIRGRNSTIIRNRYIPESVIREAVAIFCLSVLIIFITFGLLLVTEASALNTVHTGNTCNTVRLLFETISAFATNGLSVNHTSTLTPAGRIIVILAMYIGRLGPLTVALSVGRAKKKIGHIRYPEEEVIIG